jgi:hypothetical protein
VVICRGMIKNDDFIVSKLVQGFPILTYKIKEEVLLTYFKDTSPYLVNIAYGPYFSSDNVDITLFSRTLNMIASKDPHVLILGGPFLPANNSIISKGLIKFKQDKGEDVFMNYFEFFKMMIERINEIFNVSTHSISYIIIE